MYELVTALRRRGGDEVIICGYANQLTVFRRRVTGVSVEQKRQAQDRFFGRLPELEYGASSNLAAKAMWVRVPHLPFIQ